MRKMIEIKGLFKCTEVKEINGKKLLNISNSDKDQEGNYKNTYYQIWVNEKVNNLFTVELKQKLTKCILSIEGWLKVNKTDKYTNLTIYPTAIKEHIKNSDKSLF